MRVQFLKRQSSNLYGNDNYRFNGIGGICKLGDISGPVYIYLFGDILVGDITYYISYGANRLYLRLCIFVTIESLSGATDHGPFPYSFEATFCLAVLAEQYRVPSIDFNSDLRSSSFYLSALSAPPPVVSWSEACSMYVLVSFSLSNPT
jgi:hypothetical protein